MRKIILIILILFAINNLNAQSYYNVTTGISTYDTLSEYEIMFHFIDHEFQLTFEFPFFDTNFTDLTYDFDGYGHFGSSWDYNFLFYEGGGWWLSDYYPGNTMWRYSYMVIDSISVLKIEWLNVVIKYDAFSGNPTDHYMNYQVWLYENGIIEIHFGAIDFDNTTNFVDSLGIIDNTGYITGPWVGIESTSLNDAYYLCGSIDNYYVENNEYYSNVFKGIPPYGFYVRWEPNPNSINDITNEIDFTIYPNPAKSKLNLEFNNVYAGLKEVSFYDILGHKLKTLNVYENSISIDISELTSGYYIVKVISKGKIETKKLIIK